MRFQTSLLSLFLPALILASHVDASAKKNKKDKNEQVLILSDSSTGRGDAVTLPSSSVSKSRSKPASLLVDTTNTAPAVQLKEQSILVQSIPEESQVSEKDEQTKKFEELVSNNQYKEVAELGEKMSDEKLLKCLCQVVTNLDQFKGLYEYLKQRDMVPGFLAHGDMLLVRKVIVGADLLETDDLGGRYSIYDAIALSLNEDCHERAAGLFEAARERPDWKNRFYSFVEGFFEGHPPEENSTPLKRFLALYGEEYGNKHPAIFETFCEELVGKLRLRFDNPASQKLLIDLVGQPSLLTPVAFAGGFLYRASDASRTNFIKYAYKEAVEEGLKEKYPSGSRKLWAAMVSTLPDQFSGEYPNTDEARTTALKDFKPTKQDREEQWIAANASNPQTRLRAKQLAAFIDKFGFNFPTVLWVIVAEYATVPSLLDTQ